MIILEKIIPNGLFRIEVQMNNNAVEYVRYLNDKLDSTGKRISHPVSDSLAKVIEEFIDEGYIEVKEASSLKVSQSKTNPIKILSLKEFRKEYPEISLSDSPWDIGVIEVHTEDAIINGNLDLSEEGDFHVAEVTHLVFLKNLTVNGSIYSQDGDTDRSLRVMGDLIAHNLVIGGPQIYLEGKTIIRDTLMVYSDVDYKINDIHSSLYIIDHLNVFTGIKKASFDYSLYFSYYLVDKAEDLLEEEGEVLDQEAEVKEFGVYFKGNKQTWVNNTDLLSNSEIVPFLTDSEIINNLKSMIDQIEDN